MFVFFIVTLLICRQTTISSLGNKLVSDRILNLLHS